MINILLCGGSGVRLWPLSNEQYPKQFCNLTGEHSLFQYTLLRNKKICEKTIVVANEKHYSLAKEQMNELEIKNSKFILEPIGRNTAPAITIACLSLNDDDIVFISPSDHFIKDEEKYIDVITNAKKLAEEDFLVTFGIKPSCAETEYGYIEAEGENVLSFKEKPDVKTANEYFASNKYYWNSGMFMFKVKTYLEEVKRYSNEIFISSQNAFKNSETGDNVIKILKSYMEKIPSNSIDYAVMEKSDKIKMAPLDANWSDLGSFEAIYKLSDTDENGNAASKKNICINSNNNLVLSGDKLVTLIDIDDLVVVNTDDAILISKKGSSHKIKDNITKIKEHFI